MEAAAGSLINQLIGVGYVPGGSSDIGRPIFNQYPSYLANVLEVFKVYPIYETFGLTVNDAMALPVDRWRRIAKYAVSLGPKKKPDETPKEDPTEKLMLLMVEMLKVRSGE